MDNKQLIAIGNCCISGLRKFPEFYRDSENKLRAEIYGDFLFDGKLKKSATLLDKMPHTIEALQHEVRVSDSYKTVANGSSMPVFVKPGKKAVVQLIESGNPYQMATISVEVFVD